MRHRSVHKVNASGLKAEAHHCFEEVHLGEGERGAQGLRHLVGQFVDHGNVPLAVQLHRK